MVQNGLQYQLYKLDNENEINALVKDETIWLTQRAMGELFECSPDNVSLHLRNIYEMGELTEISTAEEISAVQKEGNRNITRKLKFYNLDAIISVVTWKNSPDGRVLKSDVSVAKNYLSEQEIRRLERNVSGFFDYVEDLIEDEVLLKMEDFARSIDEFLQFRRFKILTHKGKVTAQDAKNKAHLEYKEFNKTQKINSDFEKQIAKIKGGEKRWIKTD